MQFLQITLQHMGHRAEFYGAIKLSAEHWELFPLHRPLYPLLTTVPPWHLVVFKNIFVPLKLSYHLCSAPLCRRVLLVLLSFLWLHERFHMRLEYCIKLGQYITYRTWRLSITVCILQLWGCTKYACSELQKIPSFVAPHTGIHNSQR